MKENYKELIRNTNGNIFNTCFQLNKNIIKSTDIKSALLLAYLQSEELLLVNEGNLSNNESFHIKQTKIEQDIPLSLYEQRKALNRLKQLNMVTTYLHGIPQKLYYKLNYKNIVEIMYPNNQGLQNE